MEKRGLARFFFTHGYLCASHPVEVLLLCITGTVCLLTLNIYDATHNLKDLLVSSPLDKVSMPTTLHINVSVTSYFLHFLALLSVYFQSKKLIQGGISVILGVVGIFLAFSCTVYSSMVGNLFGGNFTVLREAIPFFCLFSDFVNVNILVKFAFSATSQEEAYSKIAQGLTKLGPSVTLNTLVGVLVMGVGSLSGVGWLETASYFGSLALITHYIIFMTFLPSCLSLFLEMCFRGQNDPTWLVKSSNKVTIAEQEDIANPLIQHVKVIMSAGLMFVHAHSWVMVRQKGNANSQSNSQANDRLSRFLAVYSEEVLAFILAVLVAARYMYLEKDKADNPFEEKGQVKQETDTVDATMGGKPKESSKDMILSTNISDLTFKDCSSILLKSRLTRKRSATFCLGDNSSFDESQDINSQLSTEMPVEKKKSTSFSKWKKCHSIHDILKPLSKASVNSVSHSGSKDLKMHVPKVTVSIDESFTEKKMQQPSPLKNVFEAREMNTRSVQECKHIMKEPDGLFKLTDDEICSLVEEKSIPFYQLETALNDFTRAVCIRRKVTAGKMNKNQECLKDLPHEHYDYTLVSGACCENVIGYMPIPVGVAGPLLLDGKLFYIPMATTEGCLVASTNRGCRALSGSGGVRSSIIGDGMTRGPVVRFPSAMQASEAKLWLEDDYNFGLIKKTFDGTSRFARLKSIKCAVAGRLLFARFVATTGDAMGMNMLSKGTENALKVLQIEFPCMEIISLSGNYCTDKKATAMNWIEGRGKSVVCEAIIPGHTVVKVLKTNVTALTELNTSKNLVGSAMAGAIGGFNAHAANIVTALFIATGQDPAQNMESSNCITLLEPCGPNHDDLYISCTMPSLEVGTVGGGTILPAQASCLEMLGVKGASSKEPGQNASQLARIICGTVLAGELSLLSALAAGQLVQSHLKHNRSTINLIGSDDAAKNCAVL